MKTALAVGLRACQREKTGRRKNISTIIQASISTREKSAEAHCSNVSLNTQCPCDIMRISTPILISAATNFELTKSEQKNRVMDKILKLTHQNGMEKSKLSNLFASTRGGESEDQSSKVLSAFKTFESKTKPRYWKDKLLTEETASVLGNETASPVLKTSRPFFASSIMGSTTGKKNLRQVTTETAAESLRSNNTEEQSPLKPHSSNPNIRLDALYNPKVRYPIQYKPALVCSGEYWRKEKNQEDLKREQLVLNKYINGYMIPRELKRLQTARSQEQCKSEDMPDTDDYFSKVINSKIESSKKRRIGNKLQKTMIEYDQ